MVCNTTNAWWLRVVVLSHSQACPAPIELPASDPLRPRPSPRRAKHFAGTSRLTPLEMTSHSGLSGFQRRFLTGLMPNWCGTRLRLPTLQSLLRRGAMEAGSFGDEALPPVKLDAAEDYPANKIKISFDK